MENRLILRRVLTPPPSPVAGIEEDGCFFFYLKPGDRFRRMGLNSKWGQAIWTKDKNYLAFTRLQQDSSFVSVEEWVLPV